MLWVDKLWIDLQVHKLQHVNRKEFFCFSFQSEVKWIITLLRTAVANSCSYFLGSKYGNGGISLPGTPEKSKVCGRLRTSSTIDWTNFFNSWCVVVDGIGPINGRPKMIKSRLQMNTYLNFLFTTRAKCHAYKFLYCFSEFCFDTKMCA